ncbi:P pilus assembly protein porin PapC-like protein [Shewanella halifaxensis HAW-EB4]|uniref:P pilus assembly protein porin PapC-like protein n=1 Tax=Shewanella halifaxensis (strain HAW-EB4) TaxID=458817 RepID=B0TLX5_SHEHH|nr:TcfC E-set like domain-containing protein [Shewanella halifaxensis]ABZ77347.1 P pilus assembly protein porin PapC-like protein [Shewanella halifaxensis HAW-EB4]
MRYNKIALSILFGLSCTLTPQLSLPVYASVKSEGIAIPDEFAELYSGSTEAFDFQLASAKEQLVIKLNSTPTSASLNRESKVSVEQYLTRLNVKREAVADIITAMKNITTSSLCLGKVSECELMPERYAFTYDFEHKKLSLFINADLIDSQKTTRQFHEATNQQYGVINSVNLNYHYFGDGGASLIGRDETLIGLKYGSIKSSLYADTAANKFEAEQLSYDFESQNRRFQFGHFKYGYEQNTTAFMDLSGSYSQDIINYSSSQNLIDGGKQNNRRLFYILPNKGRIEVYRDGHLIYSKNVDAGQQSIAFRDLPYGSYTASIVVISAGREILKERQQIVNNSAFSLNKGEYDYSFSAGRFNDRYDNSYDGGVEQSQLTKIQAKLGYLVGPDSFIQADGFIHDGDYSYKRTGGLNAYLKTLTEPYSLQLESNNFVEGKLSYQLTDSTMIGGRILSNSDSTLSELGVKTSLSDDSTAQLKFASFSNGSQFIAADVSFYNIGVGYEKFDSADSDFGLDNFMLSNTGYQRLNVNLSSDLWGGQGYVLYVNNKLDAENEAQPFLDQSDYWSVSAGFSHSFVADSVINFSATFQGGESFGVKDDWYASVLWSVPLSAGWSASSSVSVSRQGLDEFRNSVANDRQLSRNLSMNNELGISYNGTDIERNMSSDLSSNINYNNGYVASDTYAYISSDGTHSVSSSFNSTQVLSGKGEVYFSSEQSDAYIIVDAQNQGSDDAHRGLLSIYDDNTLSYSENIDREETIIPVNKYKAFNARLDTDSSNYISDQTREVSGYSLPGTVISLDLDLVKVKTFISSFDDVNHQVIADVECTGEGCIDVEQVEEGVFKISVIAGSDYQLVSENQTCVTPTLDRDSTHIVNTGNNYCLPGLDNDDTLMLAQDKSLQAVTIDGNEYYFIGVFTNEDERVNTNRKLEEVGLAVITRIVGQRQYLYVTNESSLSASQVSLLNELSLYAKSLIEDDSFAHNWN